MDRRTFLALTGGALAMPLQSTAADQKPMIIELERIQLRNTQDSMVQRTNDYFGKALFPALQRAGLKSSGAFASLVAPDSPFLLVVTQHESLGAWEATRDKLRQDADFQKQRTEFYNGPLQYVRMEKSLLRGFATVPGIEAPKPLDGNRSRVFELRTYESNNPKTLERKIRMFNEGEIALFRKLDILPVFFGETIVGRNMPNLTYMVAYNDLASREKAWSAFGSSPEWAKMKNQPGVSDGEIVSNISNILVRPLPFSQIR